MRHAHPANRFRELPFRRGYDEETEIWPFSVVDIIQVLTQQPDYQGARKYWKVLKGRLAKEGSELVSNCYQLKLPAADGKQRLTDMATAEILLRLMQSVPSPKAEPVKLWLARVGYERMQEIADPSRSLDRARDIRQQQGRSEKWIVQRMTGRETRNKPTDYWASHDIRQGEEFAIPTNLIHQEWAGVSVKAHKTMKGLNNHNLRDHTSEAELIFTALAELSTRQIAEAEAATGMADNSRAASQTCPQRARKQNGQVGGDRGKLPAAGRFRQTHQDGPQAMNEAETRVEPIAPCWSARIGAWWTAAASGARKGFLSWPVSAESL